MSEKASGEPTLRDIATRLDRMDARLERVESKLDTMDTKIDALQGLVVQGFANLGVQAVRRTGTGDDDDRQVEAPTARQVDIVRPAYQPSKAELNEDLRVDASFEEAVDALTRPVTVRYIPRPKRRPV